MTRSVIACRCGATLATRHHSGRLRVEPGVRVFYAPAGRHGPFLGLACPRCGRRRDWTVATTGAPPNAGSGRLSPS